MYLPDTNIVIELTRSQDPPKALALEQWLNGLSNAFQVLPADAAVFRRWAQITHGQAPHHLQDALIAATAKLHDLTVVTRNTKDFKAFKVKMINPFKID